MTPNNMLICNGSQATCCTEAKKCCPSKDCCTDKVALSLFYPNLPICEHLKFFQNNSKGIYHCHHFDFNIGKVDYNCQGGTDCCSQANCCEQGKCESRHLFNFWHIWMRVNFLEEQRQDDKLLHPGIGCACCGKEATCCQAVCWCYFLISDHFYLVRNTQTTQGVSLGTWLGFTQFAAVAQLTWLIKACLTRKKQIT